MNNIKSWLKKENIHLNLKAESELETIRTMLDLAKKKPIVTDTSQLAKAIYESEILRASHRGCSGVAFHTVSNAVSKPFMLVGRFEKGIGYFSKKNEPVDLAVLIVVPEQFEQYLKNIIKRVKDMLCNSEFMEGIRNTDDPYVIYESFIEHC